MQRFLVAVILLASALPLTAQNWSFGAATGPFVFGDLLEFKTRPASDDIPVDPTILLLTAATRAGAALDIEHTLTDRLAVRLEGTFTRAPLSLEQQSTGDEAVIDAGDLDVSTWMLPLVFRINRNGAFRFHVLAGPALAFYRATAPENSEDAEPVFTGTRSEWGVAYGGGVGWWISDRFAVEGNLTDTITSSPIKRDDLPDVPGFRIPRPHNVHTTIGVRWKF